jgi:hypothetical protein
MSLLTVIIATASILFIIIGRDAYKRGKINVFHGFIFVLWIGIIWYSLYNPMFLERLGKVFGLGRWSDIIVYSSILFLVYLFFDNNNQIMKSEYIITKLVSNESLSHISSDYIHSKVKLIPKEGKETQVSKEDFMFHVKGLNESHTIAKVIDDIIWAGFSKILIINDGSTDDMADIVEGKIKEYPDKLIILINHLINRRHGGGNKTGIQFFRKFGEDCDIKYVVFYDADDQMNIADMDGFISYLQEFQHVDVIQGSRFVEGGKAYNIPLKRKIVLRGAKLLTRIMNGMYLTDPHNGYKCFRLQALQQINITTDTTAYANELIDEYQRLGLKVVELPVHIKYSDYSLWKGQKNWNALNILKELIYRKLFYR